MRFFRSTLAPMGTVLFLAGGSFPAWAGGAEEDAKTFFAQGRELRTQGKCAEAVITFRRALEVYPEGLGALRNIAECEEQMGWYASARRDWWDLRRAALQSNEAKYAGWETDAELHYRRLGDKVAKLTIRLSGDQLQQIKVVVDGKPFDPRLIGTELERDLGTHTIEAFYGDQKLASQKINLLPSAREVVTLEIPAYPSSGQSASTDQASKSSSATLASPDKSMRTAGFIALGLGGASVVATAITVAIRASALSSIEDNCTQSAGAYSCPPEVQSDYNTGKTASTLANVFGAIGIAGVATGIVLVIAGSSDATTKASSATAHQRATFILSPTYKGARAHFFVRF